MTDADIAAIRAQRNGAPVVGHRGAWDVVIEIPISVVDALLAEVERLRAQVDDYRTLAAGMVRLLDTQEDDHG